MEWVDEDEMEDDTDTDSDEDNAAQQDQDDVKQIQLQEIILQSRNVSTTIILSCGFLIYSKKY